jgi:hypothetical protein
MQLNIPVLEELTTCDNLLIAGMGGGFDLFCGLPIYFELVNRGQRVHLGNFSFSDVVNFTGGTRLTDTLVGVDADYDDYIVYFPELLLSQWFRETRNESVTVWCFHKTGTEPLLKNYRKLVEHLHIDGILLLDGGVDSLVRGDEEQTATLIEDATSLYAVNELRDLAVRIVGCIGLGAEQDLTYPHIFENIASLTKGGGFMGCCSLTPEMESYRSYEEAVLHVQKHPIQPPSVINSSIISAVRGEYGNYHFTEKTAGSRLNISPLMALYWFFNLSVLADQNLFLPNLRGTNTFMETVIASLTVRQRLKTRKNYKMFQP